MMETWHPFAARIPGVVQVFGHSQVAMPFNVENRIYCLDCRRCFRLDCQDEQVYDLTTGEPVNETEL